MLRPFAGALEGGALRLETGNGTEAEGVLCLIDGAVHNHAELAAELGLGPGGGPEAVLARGFRRWGSGLAERLRGEFTVLLWIAAERRGVLVPDQLGVRRPVFRRQGGRLWFGSEVRYLLALLPTRPEPDPAAISHWLTARPAPRGTTLYRGVECVGPGQLVELGAGGGRLRRYWQPRYREPGELPREQLVEQIRATLSTAVARRATPGAPLGILLSGGLDSTSVAALAQRGGDGARGFSVTFPDHPGVDESEWIEAFERESGLPGVHLAARPGGLLAGGLEYLARWELPSRAWNEPWTQPLLRRARALGVRTMLSGEGGDDLFGSRLMLTADLIRAGHPLAAARFARTLPEAGGRAPREVLAHVLWRYGLGGVPPARLESAWRRLGGWGAAPWWAGERMRAELRRTPEPSWRAADGPRWWAHMSHSLTEGLHGLGLLDHMRRRTEQNGLEASHPLLDLDLFELMLGAPPRLCSEGGMTRSLFREAMAGLSPDVVRLRPDKSVFDDLVTGALLGAELPALLELLGGARELGAYVRPGAIDELLRNRPPHQRGDVGAWSEDILRLTAVELWLRFQSDPDLPARLLESPLITAPDFQITERPVAPEARRTFGAA